MSRAGDDALFLLFRSGNRIGALPIRDVWETMRPQPVTVLAGAPACVLGIARIRGLPTPVIDANRLLNPGEEARPAARFVSLRIGDRSAALAVDTVIAIRTLATEALAAVPPLLVDAASDQVSAIGLLDAEVLMVLQTARLVPPDTWRALGTADAAA